MAATWLAHEGDLRGFLRHHLSDGHAAEDLLQDVFVKGMRRGEGFCTLDNPRAWLFQVARNAVIDRARLIKTHVPLGDDGYALVAVLTEPMASVDAWARCVKRVLAELSTENTAILRADRTADLLRVSDVDRGSKTVSDRFRDWSRSSRHRPVAAVL